MDFEPVNVDETYYTLIPSRFPPIDIFARISRDRTPEVAEVESLTNPRLKERQRLLSGACVVDLDDPRLQNWNHAPFTYENPDGTRFFERQPPALELSKDIQTALVISVAKREAFLSRTCEKQVALEMRVISRHVKGHFADGTGWDPDLGEDERRRLGAQVAKAGFDGLTFRPAERPSGVCVSVLRGETLARAIQGDHFKFLWDGGRVNSLYSFSSGRAFEPGQLRGPQTLLAA